MRVCRHERLCERACVYIYLCDDLFLAADDDNDDDDEHDDEDLFWPLMVTMRLTMKMMMKTFSGR